MQLSITAIFSVFAGYFFGNFRNKASIVSLYSNTQNQILSATESRKLLAFFCVFRLMVFSLEKIGSMVLIGPVVSASGAISDLG